MTGDLAMCLAMIVHTPQVIAVWHGCEGAVQWENFQAVTRQVEIANDFRTQERHDVRADGELESGKNFFGAGRSPEDVAALEHQNFSTCLGQIGGSSQAVVASANDDYVVLSTSCNCWHSSIQMAGKRGE